jgi:hypothetical protein
VAVGTTAAAGLIGLTWADMCQRVLTTETSESGAADSRRIVLIVDHLTLLELELNAASGGQTPHPALAQLAHLLAEGRAAAINVLLSGLAGNVAEILGGIALESCGTRVALGPVGRRTASQLFGDASAASGIPARAPGAGVVVTPASRPQRATMICPPALPESPPA